MAAALTGAVIWRRGARLSPSAAPARGGRWHSGRSRRSGSAGSTSAWTPRSTRRSRSGPCSRRAPPPAWCSCSSCSPLRPELEARRADLPALALIGLLDVGANTCFTLGAETGLLSVVSVLASLYPVTTVVLARAVLGERLGTAQAAGVAIALTGVALIATA